MESRLINAKANWADSEHERELIQNKLQEINNLINDKIEGSGEKLGFLDVEVVCTRFCCTCTVVFPYKVRI